MEIQKIELNVRLVYQLDSKQEWIRRFPGALPKLPMCEKYLCIDANGNSATVGEDFMAAEKQISYPIKIYLVQRINHLEDETYLEKLLKLFR